MAKANRYSQIIEDIFLSRYLDGNASVSFSRIDIESSAVKLRIKLPKNLGDVVYSFKYRNQLPDAILRTEPEDKSWAIMGKGRSKYAFELKPIVKIKPDSLLPATKVPDSTPGLVARYALSDEQALLAKLRYNRLLDTFTGVTCYSIQNHLRTTVQGIGQVETDEIYVGLDKGGVHYVLPVQAKGRNDDIGIVQIEQDLALCEEKYPALRARSIAAQFLDDEVIALFELGRDSVSDVVKLAERHYKLVPPHDLSEEELAIYRGRRAD